MRKALALGGIALLALGLSACKNPADSDVPGVAEVVTEFEYQHSDGRVLDCLYIEAHAGYDQTSSVTCDWSQDD